MQDIDRLAGRGGQVERPAELWRVLDHQGFRGPQATPGVHVHQGKRKWSLLEGLGFKSENTEKISVLLIDILGTLY